MYIHVYTLKMPLVRNYKIHFAILILCRIGSMYICAPDITYLFDPAWAMIQWPYAPVQLIKLKKQHFWKPQIRSSESITMLKQILRMTSRYLTLVKTCKVILIYFLNFTLSQIIWIISFLHLHTYIHTYTCCFIVIIIGHLKFTRRPPAYTYPVRSVPFR